jgi:hypothetical protein
MHNLLPKLSSVESRQCQLRNIATSTFWHALLNWILLHTVYSSMSSKREDYSSAWLLCTPRYVGHIGDVGQGRFQLFHLSKYRVGSLT